MKFLIVTSIDKRNIVCYNVSNENYFIERN